MPEAQRGGLEEHIRGERCQFGPFTFGGGRNVPLAEANAVDTSGGAGWKRSERQYLQGKGRDRIGGSTTHMDGEWRFRFRSPKGRERGRGTGKEAFVERRRGRVRGEYTTV